MFTIQFWKDAGERAIKSFAQALLLVLGGNVADVWSVDWKAFVGAGLFGALLSLLTSVATAASPLGNPGTASATKAVEVAEPPGVAEH